MRGSPFREMSVAEETLKTRSSAEHLGAPLACQPCRPVGARCSKFRFWPPQAEPKLEGETCSLRNPGNLTLTGSSFLALNNSGAKSS